MSTTFDYNAHPVDHMKERKIVKTGYRGMFVAVRDEDAVTGPSDNERGSRSLNFESRPAN